LSSLQGVFIGLHTGIAMMTDTPEWQVTQDETTQFFTAAEKLARHYDIPATQKMLDTIAFIGMAGSIYVPRLAFSAQKRQAARAARTTPPGSSNSGEPLDIQPGVGPAGMVFQ
jgi:hypothetical protein